jgi:hypothetical protein
VLQDCHPDLIVIHQIIMFPKISAQIFNGSFKSSDGWIFQGSGLFIFFEDSAVL